jgi:uncharacterized protein (DUF2237 family)
LPPVEFCRGTSPTQAANSRPDLNADGSVTVAAMAAAPTAFVAGAAPKVVLAATHEGALDYCRLIDLKKHALDIA